MADYGLAFPGEVTANEPLDQSADERAHDERCFARRVYVGTKHALAAAALEDLVQEVFFRILKYRATFRNDSVFRTWIFRIARNARIDHFRSQGQREIYSSDDEPACETPSASHQLQQREDSEKLRQALFLLPQDKREVLILSRYEEMKYEEIAELLGCEIGTVKTRVHRALKELRDIFMKLAREKPSCNARKPETTFRIT